MRRFTKIGVGVLHTAEAVGYVLWTPRSQVLDFKKFYKEDNDERNFETETVLSSWKLELSFWC